MTAPQRRSSGRSWSYGYVAVAPNLFHRYAPGASPADAAAAARARAGGVPTSSVSVTWPGRSITFGHAAERQLKVGVIGYCSGGRQTYLAACSLDVDAAVDCYGGVSWPRTDDLSAAHPVAPIDLTPQMRCPLLGLFGAEDANPSPADVARIE